jgi:DNA modification methylase
MLIQADSALAPFPDKTFHCVTTSPPYWGLRKYQGEQGIGKFPNLGLESTPEEYIQNLVEIFAEVHRVLRDDGVVWLNLGDCYTGSWGNYGSREGGQRKKHTELFARPAYGQNYEAQKVRPPASYFPSGNLMLMPHRLAIALQKWGWIVRSDVVWYKPNPMPEPRNGWRIERERREIKRVEGGGKQAKDHQGSFQGHLDGGKDKVEWEYYGDYQLKKGSWRFTNAHEYFFMLTKQMKYWSDREVVAEPYEKPLDRWGGDRKSTQDAFKGDEENRMRGLHRERDMRPHEGKNPRSVLEVLDEITLQAIWEEFVHAHFNPSDILKIPTSSYPGKHYAVFPEKLIAPLIMATCPRWCCPICGQGWSPVVEKGEPEFGSTSWGMKGMRHFKMNVGDLVETSLEKGSTLKHNVPVEVQGYLPTCEHPHEVSEAIPGIVLDPFVGSGTTVMTANQLMRRAVGVDISMQYLDEQAKVRTGIGSPSKQFDDLPMFER